MGHVYVQRGKNHHEVGELHAGDLGAVTKMQNTHTDDTLVTDGVNEVVKKPAYPPLTVTMAIEAESRGDEDKLGEALKKLVDLDPTLQSDRDPVLHQTLVRGMGDMHLDVLHSRLENIQKIKSILKVPKTAYRETLQGSAEGMYRHKKQSGGRGQFGEVHIRVRPNTEGAGFEFNWKIVGGVIPTKYESAVRKGVEQALEKGIIAGYPVVDVVVECFDGKQHDVDSSDMAFMLAASQAFRQVAAEANPVILEPIFKLKTTVPDQYLGDIMGDISGKRGRILGQDMVGKKVIVEAQVPRAELYEYSKQLRSMTQGRGVFEIEFDHYERVPGDIQAKLTEDFKHPEEEH
jgi:elongation factor G